MSVLSNFQFPYNTAGYNNPFPLRLVYIIIVPALQGGTFVHTTRHLDSPGLTFLTHVPSGTSLQTLLAYIRVTKISALKAAPSVVVSWHVLVRANPSSR